jgi:hypothetical protein
MKEKKKETHSKVQKMNECVVVFFPIIISALKNFDIMNVIKANKLEVDID